MHPRAQHPVDPFERPFKVAGDAGDELRVFRRLARHERTFADGVEDARRLPSRQLLLAHRRKGARYVFARDVDAPLALGGRIGLLRRVDAHAVEDHEDPVRLAIVQIPSDGHGASRHKCEDDRESEHGAKPRGDAARKRAP